MRFKIFTDRWRGVALSIVGSVATIYLGVTKQLQLYIHPRYIIFTAIMAVVGLGIAIASFGLHMRPDRAKPTKGQNIFAAGMVGLCVLSAVGLLVIRPATLTTATVAQRSINNGGIGLNGQPTNAVPLFEGGDYTHFTVKDWVTLFAQTSDAQFFANKQADIVGFVTPDADDPQNVFYVSRFVITCCAVDARPIGVPVYAPGWQARHEADQWVRVAGGFAANPSPKSQQRIAVRPASITTVAQPKEPYVY
ncbi:MAG TPA: TIGR03943 family protein [Nevskiaceae bacterium]|nr:TIGR03943 family protein [Nevskiaceae bacterium]